MDKTYSDLLALLIVACVSGQKPLHNPVTVKDYDAGFKEIEVQLTCGVKHKLRIRGLDYRQAGRALMDYQQGEDMWPLLRASLPEYLDKDIYLKCLTPASATLASITAWALTCGMDFQKKRGSDAAASVKEILAL